MLEPRRAHVVALLAIIACSSASTQVTGGGTPPDTTNKNNPPPTTSPTCATPAATWLWCDDFESSRIASYFEFDSAGGRFSRKAGVGRNGSFGMQGTFAMGVQNSGHLSLALGVTPDPYFKPVHA